MNKMISMNFSNFPKDLINLSATIVIIVDFVGMCHVLI